MKIDHEILFSPYFTSHREYEVISQFADKKVQLNKIDDQEMNILIDCLAKSLSVESIVAHSNFTYPAEESIFILNGAGKFSDWNNKFAIPEQKFFVLYSLFIAELKKVFTQFTYKNMCALRELYNVLVDVHTAFFSMYDALLKKEYIDKYVLLTCLVDNVYLFLKRMSAFNSIIMSCYEKGGKIPTIDVVYTPYFACNEYEKSYWCSYMCNTFVTLSNPCQLSIFLKNCEFILTYTVSSKDNDAEYKAAHYRDKNNNDIIYVDKTINYGDRCSYTYICFPLKDFYIKNSLHIGDKFNVLCKKTQITPTMFYSSASDYFPIFMKLMDEEEKNRSIVYNVS